MTLSGMGSLILAWRAKKLVESLIETVLTHEVSIIALKDAVARKPQEYPIVYGMTTHLLEFQDKAGAALLTLGLGSLGLGMLISASSYFF